jgi:hypothetical protein
MLCRTGLQRLYETRSRDGGKTWSAPRASPLVSHNAPASLCRFGEIGKGFLAVWNNSPKERSPLCVAASYDDAKSWTAPQVLAHTPGRQCSYPGATETADGRLLVVWQQQSENGGREILWALFDPGLVADRQPDTPHDAGSNEAP